jgi:Phosphoglucomutase/phosphomannomutase, alpha/beta/alpha domain I
VAADVVDGDQHRRHNLLRRLSPPISCSRSATMPASQSAPAPKPRVRAFVQPAALVRICSSLPASRTSSSFTPSPQSLTPRLAKTQHRCTFAHSQRRRPRALAELPPGANSLYGLQNGSDVRGVALSLAPANSPVTLSPADAAEIAASFVRFARSKLMHDGTRPFRVAIGRDSRLSGPALADASAAGMLAAGGPDVTVTHFGLATTPAMFMSTVLEGHEYDAAIMLTASHLPPDRNGIKFFTRTGSTDKADVKRILDDAVSAQVSRGGAPLPASVPEGTDGMYEFDFIPVYARHLAGLIRDGCAHPTQRDQPLTDFKIVVDAGNGAAGFFAGQVLGALGADVVGQFLDPDGVRRAVHCGSSMSHD